MNCMYIKVCALCVLLYKNTSSLLVFRPVFAWCQTNHVCMFVRSIDSFWAILREQDDWPPVCSIAIFEEGNAVSRCRKGLVARIGVDVWVVHHLNMIYVGVVFVIQKLF